MELMKYLRACATCHSYLPPCHWLCPYCWRFVEKEYLYLEDCYRVEKKLPHLRLMDWHENNHKLIQSFIQSLKGASPQFIFKKIGLEIFSRFVHFSLWEKKEKPIFIPAPPKKTGRMDHAGNLAKSLSFYFGGEWDQVLARGIDSSFQKRKSKKERTQVSVKRIKDINKNKPIIFVDDVVTTGSTARACWKALDKPENFFIFSLAWKRPQCTTDD